MTTILVLTAAKKQSGDRVEVSVRGLTEDEISTYLKQEKRLHHQAWAVIPACNETGLFADFEDPKIEYRHLVEKQYAGPCDDVCTLHGWWQTPMTRTEAKEAMKTRTIPSLHTVIEWESPLIMEEGKWEYVDWSFVLVD